MKNLKLYISVVAFIMCISTALAHGGEDHGKEKKSAGTEAGKHFSSQAVSTMYEVVLRYEPIEPNVPAHFKLFISDYETNKPVDKAVIKLSSPEDESLKFDVKQLEPGIYEVHGQFPARKIYSLSVAINSILGPDLLLIQNIEIGKVIHSIDQVPEVSILDQSWFLILIGFLSALIVVFLFSKLKSNKSKTTLLLMLFIFDTTPVPTTILHAHNGEDHTKEPVITAAITSDTFEVPKETQFLFDIWTKKLSINDFTGSTELFGTIIPSSSGQALLSSPQNGKITSLLVQVGQRVIKGQKIAVIEQSIDAASQVTLLAEKNNINVEYDAAKKEFDRLSGIEDIASKREVSEAEARFKRAKANRALFNSNTGRSITLKSPIDGVLGNFSYSIGSAVAANETLFTVTNLSKVYVEAQVFDKDGEKIQAGVKYTVQCTNDKHKTAEVKLIALAQNMNSTNQSQRVLFEMENVNDAFKIGEFVTINAYEPTSAKQLAVPKSAITQIDGKSVVFIKDDAEMYRMAYVVLGEENGVYSVVEKGVAEGERIVINGSYALKMIYINQ